MILLSVNNKSLLFSPICVLLISLPFLIVLARNSIEMLKKIMRKYILFLYLVLVGKIWHLTSKFDVSYTFFFFFVTILYQVEEAPLYFYIIKSFYHEWMMCFCQLLSLYICVCVCVYVCVCVCVCMQSCLVLWDPVDSSLPGSYIHWVFQAMRYTLICIWWGFFLKLIYVLDYKSWSSNIEITLYSWNNLLGCGCFLFTLLNLN